MTDRIHPFRYPVAVRERLHGPAGYQDYKRYRPWLEDEFLFRCVYCLKRQIWAPTDIFVVDHLVAQSVDEALVCNYDNLVLACQWCNNLKLAATVPDPIQIAYGNCLRVDRASAKVIALNQEGELLIRILRLNGDAQVRMRERWLTILQRLATCSLEDWKRLMAYPDDLPDLSRLRPPSNSRPEGVGGSCHARRLRGELHEIYE